MAAEDDRASEVVLVVPTAEEVAERTADPEPVVVMAPVVATPAVEALELRQELDEPAWTWTSGRALHERVEHTVRGEE